MNGKVNGKRMTSKQYADEAGTHCPYCGSVDTYQSDRFTVDESKTQAYRKARCFDCGRGWHETYKLIGYEGA